MWLRPDLEASSSNSVPPGQQGVSQSESLPCLLCKSFDFQYRGLTGGNTLPQVNFRDLALSRREDRFIL